MKLIERFLNSGLYLGVVFLVTFISWSFYEETPPYLFNYYNTLGILWLILVMTLILSFFRNTLYVIPLLVSILFIINKSNMDFETTAAFGFHYIGFSLIFLGPIIHMIRFKPKFKKGYFFLGLFLIALGYVIPLIYTPFVLSAFPISLIAFAYLLVYIFFTSTVKGNLNYLFKMMMFANLLLTAQVFFYLYQGYMANPHLDLYYRIYSGWGRNLGWANINDMCFYIALTMPSYLYFIFKKPKTYLTWFLMILPLTAVILSKSRGGVIGFAVVVIGLILFLVLKGNKKHLTHGLVFLTLTLTIFWINREIFHIWWEFFLESWNEDLNDFSSGRIAIYQNGLMMFQDYPLFGAGWYSIQRLYPGARMYMYHSTFIHVLATMGLFGLSALIVHYTQIAKFFLKEVTLEKTLFLIGYLASQVHGLIDNVQYAVPYSVLIVLILAVFENSDKKTSFELIDQRYHYIEN